MLDGIVRIFIKDSDNVKSAVVREAHGRLAGIIGILCNLLLFFTKLIAGLVFSSISVTASGALEGLGKGVQSLLISLMRYVVIIMPAAFILSRIRGAVGVWNAFWITELISAIASVWIYRKSLKH